MNIHFIIVVLLHLLIANIVSKTIYNTKTIVDENSINLNNFMNLLHNARTDLKWIRDTSQLYRGRKFESWPSSKNLKLASEGDNQNLGDKWYKQFRIDELKQEPVQHAPSSPAIPEANSKPQQNLQDQAETTKNDLSHEANYKLSKFEQEKEEKNRVDEENKIKMSQLPPPDMAITSPLSKRAINSDEEIRLKIRSRLADKLTTVPQRHIDLSNFSDIGDDYDAYKKIHPRVPNYNLFKRDNPDDIRKFTNRKLLQYEYDYDGDEDLDSIVDPSDEIRLKIKSRMADKFDMYPERHIDLKDLGIGNEYDDYLKAHRKVPNYNLFKRRTSRNDRKFSKRRLQRYYDDDDDDVEGMAYYDEPPNDNAQKYKSYVINQRNKRQKEGQKDTAQQSNMVSGVLPNKLVKAIFTLAEKNENFKTHIVPNIKIKSFVEVKPSDVQAQEGKSNDNSANKKNEMINKIVQSITEMVNTQSSTRSCLQLMADQQNFMNSLLSINKNSKVLSQKLEFPIFSKQQEQNVAIDEEIDTNRFVRSIPGTNADSSLIHDKYTVIKNLKKAFNKLTSTDQSRYNTMKEFIDKHLSLLDELNESTHQTNNVQLIKSDEDHQPVKRNTNNDGALEEYNPDLNTADIKQPFNDQMSERFMKLSKMVEFMRQNSMLDSTEYDFIGNDFIL